MTLLPIILYPDPRLKTVAKPVEEVTPKLRELADAMLKTMYNAPGIGLAAPQVGVMQRLLVMDCVKEKDGPGRPMILFNPRVTWVSDQRNTYEEGCLSIPDQYADVERPAEVRVAWMDETGADQEEHFTGLWATCVQHEIDHLDGKLFVDYLSPLKRQLITRRMQKIKREKARV